MNDFIKTLIIWGVLITLAIVASVCGACNEYTPNEWTAIDYLSKNGIHLNLDSIEVETYIDTREVTVIMVSPKPRESGPYVYFVNFNLDTLTGNKVPEPEIETWHNFDYVPKN